MDTTQLTPYGTYNPMANPYNGYKNFGNYGPNNFAYSNNVMGQQAQPQMAQTNQPQNNIQFLFVPSIEVAQGFSAEKGQTVYMLNQNKPEIYAKAGDNFGLQTAKYFRLYEFDPAAEAQAVQQSQQPMNMNFTPRDEYNQFVATVSAEIAAIKQAMANDTAQTAKAPAAKKTASKDAQKGEDEK